MTGYTNVGGMSVEAAMKKGTADATATAADIAQTKIAYGKDGTRLVGTGLMTKIAWEGFPSGQSFQKNYPTNFANTLIRKIAVTPNQSTYDNITFMSAQTARYFCREVAYSGNVVAFLVNGKMYPVNGLNPSGQSIISGGTYTMKYTYQMFTFDNEEIAFFIDPGNAKVMIGKNDVENSAAVTFSKEYAVGIVYLPN